ncbi:hypothetical protein F0562_011712, partial [Nyssa sinensis]
IRAGRPQNDDTVIFFHIISSNDTATAHQTSGLKNRCPSETLYTHEGSQQPIFLCYLDELM